MCHEKTQLITEQEKPLIIVCQQTRKETHEPTPIQHILPRTELLGEKIGNLLISGPGNINELHKFSSHIVTTQPELEVNMLRPRPCRTTVGNSNARSRSKSRAC